MEKIMKICIILIIALCVQTMCKGFFGSKQRQESRGDKQECDNKNFIEVVRESNGCYSFNNCLYPQVNPALVDYACSKCEPGYVVYEDEFGGGFCYKTNAVPHCVWIAVTQLSDYPGKHICYQCERGYVLSNNTQKCTKLQDNSKRINKCDDYYVDDNGDIVCEKCDSGYTLSEDGKKCTKGCSLENCDSCTIQNGRTLCDDCNNGTIGVFDYPNYPDGFTACLTCRTWQCLLLTEDAQKYCLKGRKYDKN